MGGRGRDRRGSAGERAVEALARRMRAPPLDDTIREDLDEWIERKKASFPDSDV